MEHLRYEVFPLVGQFGRFFASLIVHRGHSHILFRQTSAHFMDRSNHEQRKRFATDRQRSLLCTQYGMVSYSVGISTPRTHSRVDSQKKRAYAPQYVEYFLWAFKCVMASTLNAYMRHAQQVAHRNARTTSDEWKSIADALSLTPNGIMSLCVSPFSVSFCLINSK